MISNSIEDEINAVGSAQVIVVLYSARSRMRP